MQTIFAPSWCSLSLQENAPFHSVLASKQVIVSCSGINHEQLQTSVFRPCSQNAGFCFLPSKLRSEGKMEERNSVKKHNHLKMGMYLKGGISCSKLNAWNQMQPKGKTPAVNNYIRLSIFLYHEFPVCPFFFFFFFRFVKILPCWHESMQLF